MKTLLLEIGTEEIPAGYIDPALAAFGALMAQRLSEARVDHAGITTCGTPRRLTVVVAGVAPRQRPVTSEILGPPRRAGYDAEGRPTVAAVKFAEKVGVPVARLEIAATPKGEYLCARVTETGLATAACLKTILPAVIAAIPFPKSMRWADLPATFARPIVSLLALLGSTPIGFEAAGIRSGRTTFGHRFMAPRKIRIAEPAAYAEALRAAWVIVDPAERRRTIAAAVAECAASVGGRVLPDEGLLDVVTHLVEYPAPAVGRFAPEFLEVPREVLITAMREHQKYFAVIDDLGRLMPHFVAVNNTPAKDMTVVARGHERVLRARLEDAKFFFRADRNTPLESMVAKLAAVLFQAQLGSVRDKVERVEQLARITAGRMGGDDRLVAHVGRAARLCKADLVSHMVGEFPKLQGTMGRVYALLQGEEAAVAAAIEEHYRPVAAGAELPATEAGAVLAIADKLDTICGCFRAGLIPTGAADPYALRRQAIGILQILRARGISVPLPEVVSDGLARFGSTADADTTAKVCAFLENRLAHLMVEGGLDKDTVAAVLGAGLTDIPSAWRRAEALQRLKSKSDFEPIAAAFKRVVNIIRKSGDAAGGEVREGLFAHPSEAGLFEAHRAVHARVQADLAQGRYDEALSHVATLGGPVDVFFQDVMVMAEDVEVRRNRLALLMRVAGLFDAFADFSKLSA
jgi:glycyl-tRNA synthetase beta chain